MTWRVGRKVLRTLYIHEGDAEQGRLIGLMDTPELAAEVVAAVNGAPVYEAIAKAIAALEATHWSPNGSLSDWANTPDGQNHARVVEALAALRQVPDRT